MLLQRQIPIAILVGCLLVSSAAAFVVVPERSDFSLRDVEEGSMLRPAVEEGQAGVATPPDPGTAHWVATSNFPTDPAFDSPFSYPNNRHVCVHPVMDIPFVGWMNNDAHPTIFASYESHWNDLFQFWTTPVSFVDTLRGRRSGVLGDHTTTVHGTCAASNGGTVTREIWYNRYENPWTAPTLISTDDGIQDYFVAMAADLNDNIWLAWEHNWDAASANDHVLQATYSTDNGVTWDQGNIVDVHSPYSGAWNLTTIATDPTNGDAYIACGIYWPLGMLSLPDDDGFNDVVLWHYYADGDTWGSEPEVVVQDIDEDPTIFGNQASLPTLVVDSQGTVHLVFQGNPNVQAGDGTLQGYTITGPAGALYYTNNEGGMWSTPEEVFPLVWTAYGDSIDSMGTMCGYPTMGIDENDGLWLVTTAPTVIYNDTIFSWNAEVAYRPYGGAWNAPEDNYTLSSIPEDSARIGKSAIYASIPHMVEEGYPQCAWTQIVDARLEYGEIWYHRAEVVGVGDGDSENRLPTGQPICLSQSYPNPVLRGARHNVTTIRYQVPEPGQATLRIYDAAGRLVRELVNGTVEAGSHEARWDGRDVRGRDVASGVYFYRLEAERAGSMVRKMVLLN